MILVYNFNKKRQAYVCMWPITTVNTGASMTSVVAREAR